MSDCGLGERLIHALAPRVNQHEMHFLNARGLAARHRHDIVGGCIDETGRTGEGDRACAGVTRGHERALHVLRFPACREADREVAGSGECLDLALEHRGVPEIVGDARDRAGVADERHGRQRTPVLEEPTDQLTNEMTGLGRTASVPEREDLVAILQYLDQHARHGFRDIVQLDQTLSHDLLVRGEVVRERRTK